MSERPTSEALATLLESAWTLAVELEREEYERVFSGRHRNESVPMAELAKHASAHVVTRELASVLGALKRYEEAPRG